MEGHSYSLDGLFVRYLQNAALKYTHSDTRANETNLKVLIPGREECKDTCWQTDEERRDIFRRWLLPLLGDSEFV